MLVELHLLATSTSPTWVASVLGRDKGGVFTADFEGENNTLVELGDGENMVLDCKVFLRQDKTVSLNEIILAKKLKISIG